MAPGPTFLFGDDWASGPIACLVIEILAGLALTSCLLYVRSSRWLFRGLTDRIRTYVFITSIFAKLIYFILDLTNLGMGESNEIVTRKFFLIYIFIDLFNRISEFSILFVVIRTVNVLAFPGYGTPSAHPKRRIFTLALLGTIGLISFITFTLVAASSSNQANDDFFNPNLFITTISFHVICNALYLVAAIYLLVVLALGMKRQRSKASLIMLFVVMSLLFRFVAFLAHFAIHFISLNPRNRSNIRWANDFLDDFMIIVIYVGVMVVALIGSGFDEMPKDNPEQELSPFATPHVYE